MRNLAVKWGQISLKTQLYDYDWPGQWRYQVWTEPEFDT